MAFSSHKLFPLLVSWERYLAIDMILYRGPQALEKWWSSCLEEAHPYFSLGPRYDAPWWLQDPYFLSIIIRPCWSDNLHSSSMPELQCHTLIRVCGREMLWVKLPQIYSPEVMAVVCQGLLLLTNWARHLRKLLLTVSPPGKMKMKKWQQRGGNVQLLLMADD